MRYDNLDTVDKHVHGKKGKYSMHTQLKKKRRKEKAQKKYVEYMTSERWALRRKQYLKTHKRICVACMSPKDVTIHHKTYRNMGNEPDEDLVCLCKPCHTAYHRIHISASRRTTDEFIKKSHEKRDKKAG